MLSGKGRQYDGHGPGRYPAGALDHDQVSRDRLLSDHHATRAVPSIGQPQGNALSQIYPNDQQTLYPVPSDTEQADVPQPVRFTNVDQILAAARSGSQIPSALQEITSCCASGITSAPG